MSEVTRILGAIENGDPQAAEQLLPLVYDELRKLAAVRMAEEAAGNTLDATALVHEAYLRLVGARRVSEGAVSPVVDASGFQATGFQTTFANRGHFFAAAAEAMRRILVDAARRKRREKHGGDWKRVDLADVQPTAPDPRDDLVALDAALTKLAAEDPQAAKLVELRHFTGMSVTEAAQALDISPRTADRLWAYARAWLHHEIAGPVSDSKS